MATAAPPPPWPSLLLVGPTGSGKTPLGDEIERRGVRGRRAVHFDFGANLRRAAAGQGDEFGLTAAELEVIRRSLASGALFEAQDLPFIRKILGGFARARLSGPGDLLVLNGLPRHWSQAEALAPLVAVETVVSLRAGPVVILQRIRLDTGRDRSGRTDDDLGSVSKRLAIFRKQTAPLLGYYKERGVPVLPLRVTASMTAAEMYAALDRGLGPAAG